jgi:hypothetical protein
LARFSFYLCNGELFFCQPDHILPIRFSNQKTPSLNFFLAEEIRAAFGEFEWSVQKKAAENYFASRRQFGYSCYPIVFFTLMTRR